MDTLDEIFVISRARDTPRLEAVMKQFKALGIANFTHFVAIEPDFTEPQCGDLLRSFRWGWMLGDSYKKGAIGCLLSHVGVCRQALAKGHARIAVFEDDVYLSKFLVEETTDALRTLDAEFAGWDMLYLESSVPTSLNAKRVPHETVKKDARGRPTLLRTFGNQCTAAMVLNASAMTAIAEEALAYRREIDVFLALEFIPKHRCYMLPWSHGAMQAPLVSTITGKRLQKLDVGMKPLFDPKQIRSRPAFPAYEVSRGVVPTMLVLQNAQYPDGPGVKWIPGPRGTGQKASLLAPIRTRGAAPARRRAGAASAATQAGAPPPGDNALGVPAPAPVATPRARAVAVPDAVLPLPAPAQAAGPGAARQWRGFRPRRMV